MARGIWPRPGSRPGARAPRSHRPRCVGAPDLGGPGDRWASWVSQSREEAASVLETPERRAGMLRFPGAESACRDHPQRLTRILGGDVLKGLDRANPPQFVGTQYARVHQERLQPPLDFQIRILSESLL